MANRTVGDAHTIHGKNPQNLIEKVIRTRIYECRYWKEECFALTSELLVDKACELRYIGGVYGGNNIPTPFLCLLQKMLQIQPDKDIVIEFIKRNEFKYCRALGALYLRLTGDSTEIFKYLETLYNDYSKLKRQEESGKFAIVHMDEFIDELMRSDRVCSIILPRLQKRHVLESGNHLEPRISILDEDLQELMLQAVEEEEELEENKKRAEKRIEEDSNHRRYSRSRSRDRDRERPSRRRSRTRSRSQSRSKDKSRRKSPKREHKERKHDRRDRSRSAEKRDRGYDRESPDRIKREKKTERRDKDKERDRDRNRDRH